MKTASSFIVALYLLACQGADQTSQPKIGNGTNVTTESAATRPIVMLKVRSTDGSYRLRCTGTLLNDSTLITAAHCLGDYETGKLFVRLPSGRHVASLKVFFPDRARQIMIELIPLRTKMAALLREAYDADASCPTSSDDDEMTELKQKSRRLMAEYTSQDLAIVLFPRGTGDTITTGGGYYGIASTAPHRGDPMMLIGFGQRTSRTVRANNSCGYTLQGEGEEVKRLGRNSLSAVSNETIKLVGFASQSDAASAGIDRGQQVSIRPGDSGGPWITCSSTGCYTRRLIGINSTSTFSGSGRELGTGINLHSATARALFERAIHCDEYPCAASFGR